MADFSHARRKKALRILRAERAGLRDLPPKAREMYVVGMLICNEVGWFSNTALHEALGDPSICQAAQNLLREAKV